MYSQIAAAKIIPHPEPLGAGAGMQQIVNEWNTGTHRLVTTVAAGRDFRDSANGLLAISRDRPCRPGFTRTHDVRVQGAGPLKITKAPLGPKVVHWAQKHGNIEFNCKSGITGTLHLSDDTMTLNP
jgi:hypothetical protein